MKKGLSIGAILFILFVLTGWFYVQDTKKELIFPDIPSFSDSFILTSYDNTVGTGERIWIYKEKDEVEKIEDFLSGLEGTELEELDLSEPANIIYTFYSSQEQSTFTVLDDQLILYNGRIFKIDQKKLQNFFSQIDRETAVISPMSEPVLYHKKYISLQDHGWDMTYMIPSEAEVADLEGVTWEILYQDLRNQVINEDTTSIPVSFMNDTPYDIYYGAYIAFEVQIDGSWYNINEIQSHYMLHVINDELYVLKSENTMEQEIYFADFEGLPTGEYRMLREIDTYLEEKGITCVISIPFHLTSSLSRNE